MVRQWQYTTHSPEETRAFARDLGVCLRAGDLLLLDGAMGVGKTHFAKGVAEGLGVVDEVTSPTFTIVAEYSGNLSFVHMDLYRLYRNPDDVEERLTYAQLFEIGFEDYIDGNDVVLIEWPHGIRPLVDDYLDVRISQLPSSSGVDSDDDRSIAMEAHGPQSSARLKERMAR